MKIKKQRAISLTVICGVIISCMGCSTIGNVLISPHPKSLKKSGTKVLTLSNTCADTESFFVGGVIAGIAVAGVQKFLEAEAKQYSASYSASNSHDDLNELCQIKYEKGNIDAAGIVDSFSFSANLEKQGASFTLPDGSTMVKNTSFKLNNGVVEVKGVQSKVAAWPVLTLFNHQNPWGGDNWSSHIGNAIGLINPFMMLHAIYGVFDPDIYEVDLKVKVRIDAVIPTNNQTSLANVAEITFPVGKVDIFDIKDDTPWKNEKALETGYMAFPIKGKVFDTDVTKFPTNVVVTVIEGNDFGDIVGKGAKLVGDKKDSITGLF